MTLDVQDIEAIASAVALKLRSAPAAKPIEPEVVGVADAMVILGARSSSAFSRMVSDLGIKRLKAGSYRRKDLTNALARKSLNA